MQGIEVSDSSAKKILEAYAKINTLNQIKMFKNSTFFDQEENLELFIKFLSRQNLLYELVLDEVSMSDAAAINIL